jgi:FtsH-binding integral membrane protein
MDRIDSYARQSPSAVRAGESANDILWVTYRWMSLGLALTGVVAWLVAHSEPAITYLFEHRTIFYVLMFAQLGLVFAFSSLAARVSTAVAASMFFAYAALTGVTFSTLFLVYTSSSIAQTFFVTAGTFAGLSVFGATTKRDLSAVGRFAMFALIGLVIATLVNMWLASSALMWITTYVGILLFAALTAYDTQKLKQMYAHQGAAGNLALIGALMLYLDFVNMFILLMNVMGRRRD